MSWNAIQFHGALPGWMLSERLSSQTQYADKVTEFALNLMNSQRDHSTMFFPHSSKHFNHLFFYLKTINVLKRIILQFDLFQWQTSENWSLVVVSDCSRRIRPGWLCKKFPRCLCALYDIIKGWFPGLLYKHKHSIKLISIVFAETLVKWIWIWWGLSVKPSFQSQHSLIPKPGPLIHNLAVSVWILFTFFDHQHDLLI